MTDTPGVVALRAHSTRQAQLKRQRVIEVVAEALDKDTPLTITQIALSASVSREFIYSHPELLEAIRRARKTQARQRPRGQDIAPREAGLLAERRTLIAQVEKLNRLLEIAREEISDFKRQRERWMGAQLDQLMQPARLTELVSENEQLTRRLVELTRLTDSQEQTLRALREELRLSRLAHSETAAELDDSRRVIPLKPGVSRPSTSGAG